MADEQQTKPGPWQKGGPSPNPLGARLYAKERRELVEAVKAATPEIVAKLVQQAKDGDVQASRLLFDKVYPSIKPVGLAVEVPQAVGATTIADKAAAIIDAATSGQITTDAAQELLTALGAVARIRELDILEQRLQALEAERVKDLI